MSAEYILAILKVLGLPKLIFRGLIIEMNTIVENLNPTTYRQLWKGVDGLEALRNKDLNIEKIKRRTRSTIYPDSVGVGHYAIDFHPCMNESPAEKAGNTEREGERQGGGQAYPFPNSSKSYDSSRNR